MFFRQKKIKTEEFLDCQGIKGDEKLEIDSTKGYYPENCRFVTKEENILRSLNLSEDDEEVIFLIGIYTEKNITVLIIL